jgi:hypothetical protein
MNVHDVPCDAVVQHLVALIQDHEEEVKTAHDGRADVDVLLQTPPLVVPPFDRVSRRQNGCARVQSGLDAGFGDRDGLLFHGFVDRHLVSRVHLVKLVDAADPVVRQHQRARLDGELPCVRVSSHTGC